MGVESKDKSDNRPERLTEEVDYLAGEVKLLSINLAIALAKISNREKVFGRLDAQFTELIKRANDTSQRVSEIIKLFRNKDKIIFSLPASTEILDKRGAYDSIEAKLNHVFRLSNDMMQTISRIKRQKQVG